MPGLNGGGGNSILNNDELLRLQGFPNLSDYSVTSERAVEYNCFAWALGYTSRCIDPSPGYFWPESLSTALTVGTFVELFRMEGYETCADGTMEIGYEKVAIYALDGEPTHAARQLRNGRWTSKLGTWEDIEHATPEDLHSAPNSQIGYGRVVQFMRRLRAD